MLLTVASANTKSTEERSSGKRRDLPANSSSGIRRTRAIGKCTVKRMEATEKLRRLSALQPIGWKKDDQDRQHKNWHQGEKPKARPERQSCEAMPARSF